MSENKSNAKAEFLHRVRLPRGHIFFHDLLKALVKVPSKTERIEILRAYVARSKVYEEALKRFVETLYHPAVIFDLGEGQPTYKKLDAQDESMAYTTLMSEMKTMYRFVHSRGMIQDDKIRERTFIQLLESLCPHEARLLLMLREKKLDKRVYPGVDDKIFREAFPTWLPSTDAKNESTPA